MAGRNLVPTTYLWLLPRIYSNRILILNSLVSGDSTIRREHHLCRALNFWKVVRKRGEQAREHPPMGAAQVWGPEVSPVTGGRRGPQEVQSGAILLLGQWPGHRLIHSFLPLRGTGRMTPRHPSLFELALGPPSLPTAYCLS
jgi:hypothetical protein